MAFDMPKEGTWEERGGWVVKALMAEFGLATAQAAGLVGNLGYESNGFRTMQEVAPLGGRGGFGWAQWTAARRVAFEQYATKHHLPPASDEANYGFLVEELRAKYTTFLVRLRHAANLTEAVHLVHSQYEVPSDALDGSYRSGNDRLRWAQRAYNGAQGGAPVVPSPVDRVKVAVMALQVELQTAGLYEGSIDGIPGSRTIAALDNYRSVRRG